MLTMIKAGQAGTACSQRADSVSYASGGDLICMSTSGSQNHNSCVVLLTGP
jgi:hypothetical protein